MVFRKDESLCWCHQVRNVVVTVLPPSLSLLKGAQYPIKLSMIDLDRHVKNLIVIVPGPSSNIAWSSHQGGVWEWNAASSPDSSRQLQVVIYLVLHRHSASRTFTPFSFLWLKWYREDFWTFYDLIISIFFPSSEWKLGRGQWRQGGDQHFQEEVRGRGHQVWRRWREGNVSVKSFVIYVLCLYMINCQVLKNYQIETRI